MLAYRSAAVEDLYRCYTEANREVRDKMQDLADAELADEPPEAIRECRKQVAYAEEARLDVERQLGRVAREPRPA